MYIKDKATLLKAIRKAKFVFVQPRFGCVESWVKVSKVEARVFVNNTIFEDSTPEDMNLGVDYFAELIVMRQNLYIG